MFDLLVDVYSVEETFPNGEPMPSEGEVLFADVPAQFLRLSGFQRYQPQGAGVDLDARLGLEWRAGIEEGCEIRNVRRRDGGTPVGGSPAAYRVRFVTEGRRRHHLELDLQARR